MSGRQTPAHAALDAKWAPLPQSPADRRAQPAADSKLPPHVLVDDLDLGLDPAQLRRCGGCGAMVYRWPCLACALDRREAPRGRSAG
jgi:hypothetical protein